MTVKDGANVYVLKLPQMCGQLRSHNGHNRYYVAEF